MGMDAGERGEHFIMKKKIAMLLAAALCMGTFAGCGNFKIVVEPGIYPYKIRKSISPDRRYPR